MIQTALLLSFPVAMTFAAANDLFTMKIPNKISLVIVASFFAAALMTGMDWQTFGLHLACGAAVLVFGFVLFQFRMLGGGDAKLMAASALWMGVDQVVFFMAYVTIFGGILALAILFYRRYIPASALSAPGWTMPGWAQRLHVQGTGIPYGIAISAAALLLYPQTSWFQALAI